MFSFPDVLECSKAINIKTILKYIGSRYETTLSVFVATYIYLCMYLCACANNWIADSQFCVNRTQSNPAS